MLKTRDPGDRLPLTTPVFHILLALAGQERHGYGILLDIAATPADGSAWAPARSTPP